MPDDPSRPARSSLQFETRSAFYAWNEEMVRRYDPARFYSSLMVRFIEGARFRHILGSIRRHCVGGIFLEIGCGPGFMLREVLASRVFDRCIGMDISKPSLGKAAERAAGASLLAGDGEIIPLRRSVVAAVCITEVIEHVPDPDAVLREAIRVLAPGGVIIVTAPNERLLTFIKSFVLKLRLDLVLLGKGYRPSLRMDEEWHLHSLDRVRLESLIEGAGLKPLRWRSLPFSFLPMRTLVVCAPG